MPGDGKGALTLGGMLMVGGAAATGVGIGMTVDEGPGWGTTGILVGLASIGVGIGTTYIGLQRQRRYREWQRLGPPAQGNGLLAGGVATFVMSGSVLAIGITGAAVLDSPPPRWVPAAMGIGGAGLAVSSFLLFVGGSNHARFQRWRKDRARVVPTASMGAQGLQVGLVGRF